MTARIADSSSTSAASFSSACTTKGFPLSQCASAIQTFRPLESIAEIQPQLQPALVIVGDLRIVDHVRRRPARFNLCALFLQARSKRFNSLLLARNARLQFLDFAMLFEKLVEQHCVHRIVTNAIGLPLLVATHQLGINLFYFLCDQPKLWDALRINLLLVAEGDRLETENCFTRFVHRLEFHR